jgi:hypothetical protein
LHRTRVEWHRARHWTRRLRRRERLLCSGSSLCAHALLEIGRALRCAAGPLAQTLDLARLREDEQRENCDAQQRCESGDRADLGEFARE